MCMADQRKQLKEGNTKISNKMTACEDAACHYADLITAPIVCDNILEMDYNYKSMILNIWRSQSGGIL